MFNIIKVLSIFICLSLPFVSFADDVFNEENVEQQLKQHTSQIEIFNIGLQDPNIIQSQLLEQREAIRSEINQLKQLVTVLTPVLENVKSDITDLGPAPIVEGENGEKLEQEPENIRNQRKALNEEQLKVEGLLIETEALISKSGRLLEKIASIRRENFIGQFFETQSSLIDKKLWQKAAAEYKEQFKKLPLYFNKEIIGNLGVMITTLFLTLFLVLGSLISNKHFVRHTVSGKYPRLSNVALSLWPPVLGLFVGLVVLYQALITQNLITEDNGPFIDRLFWLFSLIVIVFLATNKLKSASIIRNTSRWMMNSSALLYVFDAMILALSRLTAAPVISAITQSYVSTTAFALLLGGFSLVALSHKKNKEPYLVPVQFFWGLVAISLIIIAANIFGYAALSRFIFERMILVSALIMAFMLIRAFALPLFIKLDHAFQSSSNEEQTSQEQNQEKLLIFWLRLGLDILLVAISIPILAAFAGTEWVIIKDWISKAFFGFEVGSISISISTIVIAFGLFFLLLFLARLIQKILAEKILPKTRMESSIQQSIIQIVGYIGLILALLISISSIGFDLSNLALIAGALSVGIGFGLQSIVSNFVSGLILLFERPIKIGDWIITNSGEGIVKKINVRATEIETFDRTSIIIPNSELISASVKNWTHKDRIGRLIITVGVSYSSDPHQVQKLLTDYAAEKDLILKWPKPKIVFKDYADSALLFDLRFFIREIQELNEIQTQVRLDIWDLFKEANIEISFPQRDLHIRTAPGLEEIIHAK